MNWRKWREMDGNFDNDVRRKWTWFMIFSGNWWWELSSIGPPLMPFTLSGFLERTTDTKQNRSGNVLPTPARPWVEGPALPITHDASTDALWRAEEVSLFMVVLAAFSFSSHMGGYREQKFYSQLDELILIYLHACPGGLRLPSILFLSHILPRGS